ncbi:MAG: NADH-quinone oxidoreductase subunit NuoE [Candidatus Eisenbacteria bacterium]|nr:NADH-quinone oxidoreductase subunit NuoE [Candidatus Latescibacterota bacterium]MBD3302478.1 NADH-quinone oxidoreductase subunit NuoE [Candidatus Eisenbacteria bacterium]
MLSAEEKKEIDVEIAKLPRRQAACIEALKIVQRHRTWVSDEALREIGEYLEMSPDELESVATFYNLIFRRPVGRHVIFLCDSVSCWIMGGETIREALSKRLGIGFGETSEDGRFTLLPIQCLGTCDRAPALMIDEDTHRDLSPDRLDAILEKYE